ncbi:MAG: hypothetical protein KBF85_11940 [Tabrizicola sp.]|nr:hypothetical protein [Tabrizicola sp.]
MRIVFDLGRMLARPDHVGHAAIDQAAAQGQIGHAGGGGQRRLDLQRAAVFTRQFHQDPKASASCAIVCPIFGRRDFPGGGIPKGLRT